MRIHQSLYARVSESFPQKDLPRDHATISIPMLRAEPEMIEIAFSSLPSQFRSGSLIVAISATCAAVTFPTFTFCPFALPAFTPALSLSRKEAGGVFSSREKLLSCEKQVSRRVAVDQGIGRRAGRTATSAAGAVAAWWRAKARRAASAGLGARRRR